MSRPLLRHVLVYSLLSAGACAPGAPGAPGTDDDEASLTSYDNLLAGAPANESLPEEDKHDTVYPATYSDLVSKQSPVKSQGSRGVCSIFSTVALMESLYITAGQANPDFSEQYLQWSVKNEVGSFKNTSGSNASDNLQAISRFGIPVEAAWPYESSPWSAANDPACAGEESSQPTRCFTNGDPPDTARMAEKFKLPSGRWVNTRDLKHHLMTKKQGVIVGLDFFYQSWNHRKSTLPRNMDYWNQGYVTFPNDKDVEESHKQRAGHSVLIVGWDDTLEVPVRDEAGNPVKDEAGNPVKEKGFYVFKNSWGTAGFGIANPYGPGYGYLSMKYVEAYGSAYASGLPRLQGGTTMGDRIESTVGQDIPDNDAAGITSVLRVATRGPVAALSVELDVSHSYVGDLEVTLEHAGKAVTLHANEGGSQADLKKTYELPAFVGLERSGTWTLKIVDSARADAGRLNRWALSVR